MKEKFIVTDKYGNQLGHHSFDSRIEAHAWAMGFAPNNYKIQKYEKVWR